MRTLSLRALWALTVAATLVATPVRVADARPAATTPALGLANSSVSSSVANTASVASNTATTSPEARNNEVGSGWNEVYCMGCVGLGAFALYSGGITMLPVLLANASAVGTYAGTCIVACESVIKEMMQ